MSPADIMLLVFGSLMYLFIGIATADTRFKDCGPRIQVPVALLWPVLILWLPIYIFGALMHNDWDWW